MNNNMTVSLKQNKQVKRLFDIRLRHAVIIDIYQ
jgi:hypothetical protein